MKTLAFILFLLTPVQEDAELTKRLQEHPEDIRAREQLAESYLRQLRMEEALNQWREILKRNPDHPRSKEAVRKLTDLGLSLDSRLDFVGELLEQGISTGVEEQIEIASSQSATPAQQARIKFLAGRLREVMGNTDEAMAIYMVANRMFPESDAGAEALYRLGAIRQGKGEMSEAKSVWERVIAVHPRGSAAVRAKISLAKLLNVDQPIERRYAAFQELLQSAPDDPASAEIYLILAELRRGIASAPSPEEIAWCIAAMEKYPSTQAAKRAWERIRTIPGDAVSTEPLKKILSLTAQIEKIAGVKTSDLLLLRIRCHIRGAVIASDPSETAKGLEEARKLLSTAAAPDDLRIDATAFDALKAETFLVESEKAVRNDQALKALPPLREAVKILADLARKGDAGALQNLFRSARLFEHIREWDGAIGVYRLMYKTLPSHERSANALFRIAEILETKIADPLGAIEAYRAYTAAFPPPDRLAIADILSRVRRLGYASVIEFQAATGIKADGLYGAETLSKLSELEETFREILPPPETKETSTQGRYVHDAVFRIAKTLHDQGRYREALIGYEEYLNLFPTKQNADEALYNIGIIFQECALFDEAIGAYRRLTVEYPKGNMTSEGYLRMAECFENLGKWTEAEETCKLYVKMFPAYKGKTEAAERAEILKKIQRYQEFLDSSPQSPRVPEALYEIGKLLYKERKNYRRAAVAFGEIADRYPTHYHASEAQFMVGTIHLHVQNFERARSAFRKLVEKFSESRLADDGQFWIGHTYEYEARALGELDKIKVTLKRRMIGQQRQLQDDLGLRRRYLPPEIAPLPVSPDSPWSGENGMTSFAESLNDRVKKLCLEAIAEYRKVFEKFKTGDMADQALARIGNIYMSYLENPEKGVEAYRTLLENYPGSRQAVDAQYEVGVHYQKSGNYADAVKAFDLFVYHYANDPRVAEAMLAIAECHAKIKDWIKAIDAYESFLNKFPNSPKAPNAKEQIEWIKKYRF